MSAIHVATARPAGGGGIIPARAGFTRIEKRNEKNVRDHPRSRGVYLQMSNRALTQAGSSPLARGLPSSEMLCAIQARIIPARAGFTSWSSSWGARSGIIPARAGFTGHSGTRVPLDGDHPRSRGVYSAAAVRDDVVGGSSPLARGLRPRRPCSKSWTRIIPARAGFTSSRPTPWKPTPGSSPLARGLHVYT